MDGESVEFKERMRSIDRNISSFIKNTGDFRNLLNTSKGRDKFCQLLQYISTYYITCM